MRNKNLILLIFTANNVCMLKNVSVRRNSMSGIEKDSKGNPVEQSEMQAVSTSDEEQNVSKILESVESVVMSRVKNASPACAEHCLPEFKSLSSVRRNSQSEEIKTVADIMRQEKKEAMYRLVQGDYCVVKKMFDTCDCEKIKSGDASKKSESIFILERKDIEFSSTDKSGFVSLFTSKDNGSLSCENANKIVDVLDCSESVYETLATSRATKQTKIVPAKFFEEQERLDSNITSPVLRDNSNQFMVGMQLPLPSFFYSNSNNNIDGKDMSKACLLSIDCIKENTNDLSAFKPCELLFNQDIAVQQSDGEFLSKKSLQTLLATENAAIIEESAAQIKQNPSLSALNIAVKKEVVDASLTITAVENQANSAIIAESIVADDANSEIAVAKIVAPVQNKIKRIFFALSLFLFMTSMSFLIYKIYKNNKGLKHLFDFKINIFESLFTLLSFAASIVCFFKQCLT